MSELSLQAISKTYDNGALALAPVDLVAKDGQFVVLVGPSGCGKSTLLRIIAGLEQATSGTIEIDGVPITDVPAKARDVAMVFQNYALYPHMTVEQNLEFSLKMRGMAKEDRRREIGVAAELLQLTELLKRYPSQLSGGQQQRVALGRAIVRKPKLFLLDEPFSNLDATLRASTRTELIRLHRRLRTTTVFVTHDQVEAMSMADVLVVLKDGKVQQIGAPLEVYRRPVNLFVAGFIGSPPMNVIEMDGKLLGLRAEQARVVNPGDDVSRGEIVTAKVILLEPLGNEILATCLVAGQDVTIRLPSSSTVRTGQEIRLALDMEQAVWFDPATGVAIEKNAAVLT